MSEVTVSLVKAKREDVTGTEMAGRKTKMENFILKLKELFI